MTSLEHVLADVQKNGRVCPQPQRWQQLFDMLPDKKRRGAGWDPSLPLILAAWWDTPAMSKMLRLREHIEWAASHGCLEEVNLFLRELSEDQWHHIGEQQATPNLSLMTDVFGAAQLDVRRHEHCATINDGHPCGEAWAAGTSG